MHMSAYVNDTNINRILPQLNFFFSQPQWSGEKEKRLIYVFSQVKCKQTHPAFELGIHLCCTCASLVSHFCHVRKTNKYWRFFIIKGFQTILFTNPSARAGYDTRSIFKRSLTGMNSEFSFSLTSCLTKAEEPSLSYYLPIAGERIIGFIPFPRVLVLCEMQSVSSRIWTHVAASISYDGNHYTTGTSVFGLLSSSLLLLLFPQYFGSCRFNSDCRRVTIQKYLTLVPSYG